MKFLKLIALFLITFMSLLFLSCNKHDSKSKKSKKTEIIKKKLTEKLVQHSKPLKALPHNNKSKNTQYHIDLVNNKKLTKKDQIIDISSEEIIIKGWAIDTHNRSVAKTVYFAIDGKFFKVGKYGIPRQDVEKFVKINNTKNCGFKCIIPTDSLSKGKHLVKVHVQSFLGKNIYLNNPNKSFYLNIK